MCSCDSSSNSSSLGNTLGWPCQHCRQVGPRKEKIQDSSKSWFWDTDLKYQGWRNGSNTCCYSKYSSSATLSFWQSHSVWCLCPLPRWKEKEYDLNACCRTASEVSNTVHFDSGNWDVKTKIPEQCRDSQIQLSPYFNEWINLKDVYYNFYKERVRVNLELRSIKSGMFILLQMATNYNYNHH
jgi:hypothetical protein